MIDKSALQSLAAKEGLWLARFFHLILVPPLFLEIRAGLAKAAPEGRTPEHEVAILADKIPGYAASVSIDHYNICVADLLGNEIEMRGRPLIGGARELVTADGRRGYFIDEPPEIRSLRNWRGGDFSDADWEFARQWRQSLGDLDLSELQRASLWVKDAARNVTTLQGILEVVDQGFGNWRWQYQILELVMNFVRVPSTIRPLIVERWRCAGRPMVGIYAPYATHVARLDMFFYMAIARGLLGPRTKHMLDISYLYYLPFCRVFVSNDKLHKQLAPLFLSGKRIFISGGELKSDLASLVSIFEQLPREIKRRGAAKYARYPPLEGDFLISKIYDALMPWWREEAIQTPVEITPDRNEAIMKEIRPFFDAIAQLESE